MIINSTLVSLNEGEHTVRFFDYDGTILAERKVYTGQSAIAPTPPTIAGLDFVEWNNAFTNIQADLDVGATRKTTDGKTHAFVRVTVPTGLDVTLFLNKSDGSTLTVDWGDGSTPDTFTDTGNFNTGAHTYAAVGDYEITLDITTGSGTYEFGNGSAITTFVGGNTQKQREQLISLWVGNSADVTSIGGNAFRDCFALTSIVIPSGITSIGGSAFRSCLALTSIVIPSGVTSIGGSAFLDCRALASIVIPSGVTSIGGNVFRDCRALTSIVVPAGIDSIEADAFRDCGALTSIVISSGVTSIGESAFQDCRALTSIVIPADVTSIGTNAFRNCFALTSIVIPSGITSIGVDVFRDCRALTSIVIPSGVTSIGGSAFLDCRAIKSYEVLATVPPTLADVNAFTGILASTKIFVPAASVDAYKAATNWITYADYIHPLA